MLVKAASANAATIRDRARFFGKTRLGGHQHATLPRGQNLPVLEAKGACGSEASCPPSVPFRPLRMRSILEEDQLSFAADRVQTVYVAHGAAEMHGHNGLGLWRKGFQYS